MNANDLSYRNATRRDLATQREAFTPEQAERLQSLAASGPLAVLPVDQGLALRGWIEQYDGLNSVDLVDAAPACLVAVGVLRA
mgnify:CR=1 FL=1|tara:strand:- start:137 stop:385 length:249 start_codon:yes stop_codon:yes gene_type:complete